MGRRETPVSVDPSSRIPLPEAPCGSWQHPRTTLGQRDAAWPNRAVPKQHWMQEVQSSVLMEQFAALTPLLGQISGQRGPYPSPAPSFWQFAPPTLLVAGQLAALGCTPRCPDR